MKTTEDEIKRLLSLIEKSGQMRQKNQRLSQGVLSIVLDYQYDKIQRLLQIVKTYRNVYNILRQDGLLPDFVEYKSFAHYFSNHQIDLRKQNSPKLTQSQIIENKTKDLVNENNTMSVTAQTETARSDVPDEPVVKKPVQSAPARKLTREEQDRLDFKKYFEMATEKNVLKPKPGIFVDPVPGAQPDTEQTLKDGTVVKAGDPRFISTGLDIWRNGIPLVGLEKEAEDEWEKANDMKEVRPVWKDGDYPNIRRPKHLFLLTKFNPGYPKRHIFKSYDMSFARYYRKFPPLFYDSPYLVTNMGCMYDIFYQLPLLEDCEVNRGSYIFWGYPGDYFENVATYRGHLDSVYKRNLDIISNKPPLIGRHAYIYVGPDDIREY